MAFFPHLFYSLTQAVEDVFLCSLPAWRLQRVTEEWMFLQCSEIFQEMEDRHALSLSEGPSITVKYAKSLMAAMLKYNCR